MMDLSQHSLAGNCAFLTDKLGYNGAGIHLWLFVKAVDCHLIKNLYFHNVRESISSGCSIYKATQ